LTRPQLRTTTWRTALGVAATAAFLALPVPFALSEGSGGIGPGGGGTVGSDDGVFPLPGPHTYGDGFGAGRSHEGQDLLAKCGKPVVSAYSGRVQTRDYQSAAGNYVVIDAAGKLLDTAYMHLAQPSKLRKRERVEAGDLIGRVGDTGDASTCHLHFEMWSQPGWYEGGSAIDPEPYLRRWDRG
jgi:murein DD-endopeptidase MepM/ murein hydrolase activator NlpD